MVAFVSNIDEIEIVARSKNEQSRCCILVIFEPEVGLKSRVFHEHT